MTVCRKKRAGTSQVSMVTFYSACGSHSAQIKITLFPLFGHGLFSLTFSQGKLGTSVGFYARIHDSGVLLSQFAITIVGI